MIGSLRGVLVEREIRKDKAAEILVEVGGVGYRLVVPGGCLSELGDLGGSVFVHVHTHVREDAIVLYGFATRDQRVCFEALIAAHGVGPALALALLSVHSPSALRQIVASGDADALTVVPGVGPKSAARLLIELASRLELDLVDSVLTTSFGGGTGAAIGDVRSALAALGYGPDEIRVVLARLPDHGGAEELLRQALQELAAAR